MDKINFYYFDAWIHPLFLRWMFERDMNLILFFFSSFLFFRINSFQLKFIGCVFIQLRHQKWLKNYIKFLSKLIIKIFSFGEKCFFFFGKIAFFCVLNVFWLFKEKKLPFLCEIVNQFRFYVFFLNQIKKRSYRLSN